MLTHFLLLGAFGIAPTLPSPIVETGPIIATAERTVAITTTSAAPYQWASPFDPADRVPHAIDWSNLLPGGETISSIRRLTMSAAGASVGLAFDTSAGRTPVISTDGRKVQFWFLCDSAFQESVVFKAPGVSVPVSALIRTSSAPYKEFERTVSLVVKHQ